MEACLMEFLPVFLSILGALLLGAMSPGPSFVMVSRLSIAASRRDGLAAAVGMGVGGAMFAGLALVCLTALLMQVTWLYLCLKIAGGAYLIYLGFRIWRGASEPLAFAPDQSASRNLPRSFAVALMTQLSNPKTAVVYGSIFAALLPPAPPLWMLLTLPPLIFCIEAGWYSAVALAFSAEKPRAAYLRSKTWVDRAAGAVMAALGIRLLIESSR
jgi:threonine/homoserine/homoserine lactone efflux protein